MKWIDVENKKIKINIPRIISEKIYPQIFEILEQIWANGQKVSFSELCDLN